MEGTAINLPATDRWHLPGWLWVPAVALLVAWQGWLTLGLFGSDPHEALDGLCNDRPLISGSYAQHLALGRMGAQNLAQRGNDCAYDPSFQAGYLKTPIFDGS